MKYPSTFLMLAILLACKCENKTITFKGKLLSSIDSATPLPNYQLYIRYYQTGPGEPMGCHDFQVNTNALTNSIGEFSLTLETSKSTYNTIIIHDSNSHTIYDSLLYDNIGNLYTTP